MTTMAMTNTTGTKQITNSIGLNGLIIRNSFYE
jgi:hypothetical protein